MDKYKHNSIHEKLIKAIVKDDFKTVATLLNQGANPNGYIDEDKISPLFFAAQSNALQSAKLLLAAGADPHYYCESYDSTPIGMAKLFGHRQMIELLTHHNESITIYN